MSHLRIVSFFLVSTLSAPFSLAADDSPVKRDPLFADNELLEITIRAPFTTLMRERPVDEDTAAELSYSDAELGEVTLDIGIRTRGRYRQQRWICPRSASISLCDNCSPLVVVCPPSAAS